jgi:hypothetical protein
MLVDEEPFKITGRIFFTILCNKENLKKRVLRKKTTKKIIMHR